MSKALPTVAIVGQANVGKSSLFNRIYGTQEAIVAREAGTTRDNVVRRVSLEEQSFWLVDTAGLKTAEDDFEASIQEQIEEAADAATIIVVVVDGTRYVSDQDRYVAKKALKSKKPVILAINKSDLKETLPIDEFKKLGIKTYIRTSAEHNRGVGELVKIVTESIPKVTSAPVDDDVLRIALIGRPNVGKSNLFNTLAGKQQAIVANIAGTTRDVNRVGVKYHGREVELLDTAGIRRSGKVERGMSTNSMCR
jgi:GTP-binding protein